MGRIHVQSLSQLRSLASNRDEPLEVVRLIGVARFTKWVMWLEEMANWYIDEDGSVDYYDDESLAIFTTIPAAIKQGTLYIEQDGGK